MEVSTWNIAPDYDSWGIDDSWSCENWVTWHVKLKEHFGDKTAREIWNFAWDRTGNLSSNLDCRTFNTNFRSYVKSNNLQVGSAGVFQPILDVYGTGQDIVTGGLDTVSSVFGGKAFKTTLTIVLVGALFFGGIYAYNTFKKK